MGRDEDRIRARALELGFDVCRFASVAEAWPASARLQQFIAAERHGSMDWIAETAERRAHPNALWTEARSAVVLGLNYGPDADPREALLDRGRGAISVYAQGDDYHDLIKGRLKQLGGWMAGKLGGDLKVFVDTAPLMEKPLAERAGLGWQGKHTNLVSRDFGAWLFLGSVLTTLELRPDPPQADHCGSCTACLDACPTAAFPAPYQLDARRCLSYLTIEHAGPWPEEFRRAMGNRIYGCDDCLAACPWNKFAQAGRELRLQARDALRRPKLEELARLDDAAFRALFSKSPVKRIGRDRFVRNVLYAIGNSADPALTAVAAGRLDDPSDVVRDAAGWALARLQGTSSPRPLGEGGHREAMGEWVSPSMEGPPVHTPAATVQLAQELRRRLTPPEARLWTALATRPAGLKFRRQHPFGRLVLDFYCASAKLAVEVDGLWHEWCDRPDRDERRDAWLAGQGIEVLRVSADAVRTNLDDVVALVVSAARPRIAAGAHSTTPPARSPSPIGRGDGKS